MTNEENLINSNIVSSTVEGDVPMKKMIILTLIFVLFALPATGEAIDLSAINYDDLIELRDAVEVELKTRPEYEETGYSGLFIGGKNIVVGSYTLTCVGDVTISRWTSKREYERAYDPTTVSEHINGESVMISFDDDTHILVEKGTVIIQPAIAEWVPKVE